MSEDIGHAKLSPSSSKRWINCPGSIALIEKAPPQLESSYAKEGTAAHALAEKCLVFECDASDYIGTKIVAKDDTFKVTEEMAEAVQMYLDTVRKGFEGTNNRVYIEQKFDVSWIHPGIFGSNDASIYDVNEKLLTVFDYKHGKGVVVDIEWNTQLIIYALGAMHSLWLSQSEKTREKFGIESLVEHVALVIVQPRAFGSDPVKTWCISSKELLYWARHVLKPAAEETKNPKAKLRAGEHCRWCPAMAICPEQVRNACEVAKCDFDEPLLPAPEDLSENDIAKVLRVSEVISDWATQVASYAQRQLEIGIDIPGYKLVEKKAHRKWIDEEVAEQKLRELLSDEAYKSEIVSLAQAEKLLKKRGVDPGVELAGLWEKPVSGYTIAKQEDKREGVQSPAALDFNDLTG